jgi:hypothetical protein
MNYLLRELVRWIAPFMDSRLRGNDREGRIAPSTMPFDKPFDRPFDKLRASSEQCSKQAQSRRLRPYKIFAFRYVFMP